jgi:hypothetical protein
MASEVKSLRARWAGHVTGFGDTWNACKSLVGTCCMTSTRMTNKDLRDK